MMNTELIKRFLSSIILVPLTIFFIIKGSFIFNFFLIICFIITTYEWYKMTKNKSYSIIGIIFLLFSFYSIYKIRNNFDLEFIYLLFRYKDKLDEVEKFYTEKIQSTFDLMLLKNHDYGEAWRSMRIGTLRIM